MSADIAHTQTAVEFDEATLDRHLRVHIDGLSGTMRIERIHGGQSNPTFFGTYDNRRLVLRNQPPGSLLPSAHAIDREYRILTALAGTDVPVPKALFFHAERDVVGTPFYVMHRLEGRVFNDCSLPGGTGSGAPGHDPCSCREDGADAPAGLGCPGVGRLWSPGKLLRAAD